MTTNPSGTIGVQQAAQPDRLVDNSVLENDQGQTVHRQRIDAPDLADRLEIIAQYLQPLAALGIAFNPATGGLVVDVSSQTLLGLTTLSTLVTVGANQMDMSIDQHYAGVQAEQALLSNIVRS